MKVLIFGDSHSNYFRVTRDQLSNNPALLEHEFNLLKIRGATISGFGKRNSTLNSQEKLRAAYKKHSPDNICFALGQVDIELGYYYRLVVKEEKIDFLKYAEELASSYICFITNFCESLQIPLNKIILKGVNISVLTESRQKAIKYTSKIITENIKDPNEINDYKSKLSIVFPDAITRCSHHISFNNFIKRELKSGMSYFDINDLIVDPVNAGKCKRRYIPAGMDHHVIDSLEVRDYHISKLIEATRRP